MRSLPCRDRITTPASEVVIEARKPSRPGSSRQPPGRTAARGTRATGLADARDGAARAGRESGILVIPRRAGGSRSRDAISCRSNEGFFVALVDAGSRSPHDEAVTADDSASSATPRRATTADAAAVAQMLHDFNTEFATPTPGPEELRSRLTSLLAGDDVVILLVGEPASGVAVLSFRPNVWYRGPVAVLEELYVRPGLRGQRLGSALLDAACELVRGRGGELIEINVDGEDTDARRFYETRGFSNTEPKHTEPLLYYYRQL